MAVAWNPYQQNTINNYGLQQNILPQQQVLQIDGPESIQQLRMYPNSSVLLMEKHRAVIWLCMTDSLGNITSNPYDYTPHEEKPAVDITTVEERLAALETNFSRLEGMLNGNQSYAGRVESNTSNGSHGKSKQTQANDTDD